MNLLEDSKGVIIEMFYIQEKINETYLRARVTFENKRKIHNCCDITSMGKVWGKF